MTTAAELRAQADQLEHFERIADEARVIKAAYAANTGDPSLRAAHREATLRVSDARESMNVNIDDSPGSVIAQVETVGASATTGM
jgi:hypothetical protein